MNNLHLLIKVVIPLSAIAVISRAFPQFSFLYYLLIPSFAIIFFAGYKYFYEDKVLRNLFILLFIFGLWSALTSLWSDYPLTTISRSGYFIFISFGAVAAGYFWQQFEFNPLSFLLPANIVIVVLSLFSLITNIPAESWTGGNAKGFMGFAGHQNTLASVILFTMPSLFNKIVNHKSEIVNQKTSVRHQASVLILITYCLMLTASLLFLILTYSRASWLALICGAAIFLILSKKWRVLIYSSATALLFFFLFWFTPYLKEKANDLVNKDFPEFYSSREWLWGPSYRAALSGGLFGLGYGISHPEIIVEGTGSHYENGRYIREKGNSFLALIEEVGITGFVLFIFPFAYIIKKNIKEIKNQNTQYSILNTQYFIPISAFITLLIHSQFEAWMVGIGSVQLPLFFMIIGSLTKKL